MKKLESTPDLLWQTVCEFVDRATATEWENVKAQYKHKEMTHAANANPKEKPKSITTLANYKTLMEELDKKHVPTKLAWSTREWIRNMKKPWNMSVESFKTRVSQVNSYLSHMPNFRDLNKPFKPGEL
jgi:hypothetical protein